MLQISLEDIGYEPIPTESLLELSLEIQEANEELINESIKLDMLDTVNNSLRNIDLSNTQVAHEQLRATLSYIGQEHLTDVVIANEGLGDLANKAWNKIKETVSKIWDWIMKTIKKAINAIRKLFGGKDDSGEGSGGGSVTSKDVPNTDIVDAVFDDIKKTIANRINEEYSVDEVKYYLYNYEAIFRLGAIPNIVVMLSDIATIKAAHTVISAVGQLDAAPDDVTTDIDDLTRDGDAQVLIDIIEKDLLKLIPVNKDDTFIIIGDLKALTKVITTKIDGNNTILKYNIANAVNDKNVLIDIEKFTKKLNELTKDKRMEESKEAILIEHNRQLIFEEFKDSVIEDVSIRPKIEDKEITVKIKGKIASVTKDTIDIIDKYTITIASKIKNHINELEDELRKLKADNVDDKNKGAIKTLESKILFYTRVGQLFGMATVNFFKVMNSGSK